MLRAALLAAIALLPGLAPAAAVQDEAGLGRRISPVVAVAHDVGPAVVNVYQNAVQAVELRHPLAHLFGPQYTKRSSLGSGFIIDPDGYILTNAHVIPLGKGGIQVRLHDDSIFPALLISIDPDNDVALLKITPPDDRELKCVTLGTSSDLMVGETVVAIGNPLGNENSVSSGIISSLYRDVRVAMPSTGQPSPAFKDFIQTDTPINPGNSGGPLLNVVGKVIGINWAVESDAQGIGFAIPIDRVRHSLVDKLLSPRLHREVDTGARMQGDVSGRDVKLAQVDPDGPAAHAGLRAGDRLVQILDQPIEWEFDVNKALVGASPGDVVPVVVRRGGDTIRTKLTLQRDESPVLHVWRHLGLTVVDHPRYKGVVVERVDPAGPGAMLGLRKGDLIDGVDEDTVDSATELYERVRDVPPGGRLTLHVWRGDVPSKGRITLR